MSIREKVEARAKEMMANIIKLSGDTLNGYDALKLLEQHKKDFHELYEMCGTDTAMCHEVIDYGMKGNESLKELATEQALSQIRKGAIIH